MSANIIKEIKDKFLQYFGKPDFIVRSPGRINLIGEHTDYNLGFVLPAAIDKAIYLAIQKRNDTEIHLVAGDLNETYQTRLDSILSNKKSWSDYVIGIVDQLVKKDFVLHGFNAVLIGDIPLGAGLSSSAAVECATIFALNTLFDLGLDRKSMVQISQNAENEFVGVQCGIMDQFASMFGKKDQVIQLDCRSLDYKYVPFNTSDISILLFDTGIKHSLASSEYNLRRQECEAGVKGIQKKYSGVQSLRDADIEMVNECLASGKQTIFLRCKYVVEEIQRLQDACNDLAQNSLVSFGKKMFETHEGLSKLYQVSCKEADALVDMVKNKDFVLGARMMGGGFGGCTINIIRKGNEKTLIDEVAEKYLSQFGKILKAYEVSIVDGTSLVT